MSETFTVIETQEQFDNAIKERLNRQNEKHAAELAELNAKYADYDTLKASAEEASAKVSELTAEIEANKAGSEEFKTKIAEYEAKIKQYETDSVKTKVAAELGLTFQAIEFLKGETEEDIRASAEKLLKIAPQPVAPMAQATNQKSEDGVLAEFRKLNPDIKL